MKPIPTIFRQLIPTFGKATKTVWTTTKSPPKKNGIDDVIRITRKVVKGRGIMKCNFCDRDIPNGDPYVAISRFLEVDILYHINCFQYLISRKFRGLKLRSGIAEDVIARKI